MADPRQCGFLQWSDQTAFCTAGRVIPAGMDGLVSPDGNCSLPCASVGRGGETERPSALLHTAGGKFPLAHFLFPLEELLAQLFDPDGIVDPGRGAYLPVLEIGPPSGNHDGSVLDLVDVCRLSQFIRRYFVRIMGASTVPRMQKDCRIPVNRVRRGGLYEDRPQDILEEFLVA